jgi:VanZ family protein
MKSSRSRPFYIWLTAAILWMAVILMKSAQTYQQQSLIPFLSENFTHAELSRWLPHIEFAYDHTLVSWRNPNDILEFFIRKAGHLSEYFVLSLLLGYALLSKPLRRPRAIVSSSFISLGYAASDEWHQTFVSGRTGHVIDVAVDAIGIVLAVVWFLLLRPRNGRFF